jgi:hypothetical protein
MTRDNTIAFFEKQKTLYHSALEDGAKCMQAIERGTKEDLKYLKTIIRKHGNKTYMQVEGREAYLTSEVSVFLLENSKNHNILMSAVMHGRADMVRALLELDIVRENILHENINYETAFSLAKSNRFPNDATHNYDEVIRLLEEVLNPQSQPNEPCCNMM